MKKLLVLYVLICPIWFGLSMDSSAASKQKTYTISTKSKPLQKGIIKSKKYTNKTKHFYLLDGYLRKIEKNKGGKLIVKKGTYKIARTLYIPSNTTIEFQDGVHLEKLKSTDTKYVKPTNELFMFLAPSKANKKALYSQYNGQKNIKLVGKGNVTVDLKYKKYVKAIVMGHNANITIDNLDFINAYGASFVHMVASKNVIIKNSEFANSHQTIEAQEEKNAIHIDTPDAKTKDWTYDWSKFDNTPNANVTIKNNIFVAVDRAVGTRKYSMGKYHKNIHLLNNEIKNVRSEAIRVINWDRPVITGNQIDTVGDEDNFKSLRGILVSGAKYPTITHNKFSTVARGVQFIVWKNQGYGQSFPLVRNSLSTKNKQALKQNEFNYTEELFIRINDKGYEDYGNPEKIYIDEKYRFQ
ncbi:right-handed parallel beta-helix repeat-containing protein [Kurthia sibirica]|uniref:Right-handed parallel beta-helix repeat-containing protein n=1 Tax=Kurthia sibirica TaxID=202750 RepID=A0A2U3ANY0_9BACL|nr:right-handed parallel beta-helix repeat-containing protein [Kurthia sibirica]PWI26258.1 right-handed parallel beta-helix repeat-containing protein [Kurthia sibirica]GEK33873.1 hypothetical protein KSI01_14060 [Kurthia sibirica]